jgi:hypothetical protein
MRPKVSRNPFYTMALELLWRVTASYMRGELTQIIYTEFRPNLLHLLNDAKKELGTVHSFMLRVETLRLVYEDALREPINQKGFWV